MTRIGNVWSLLAVLDVGRAPIIFWGPNMKPYFTSLPCNDINSLSIIPPAIAFRNSGVSPWTFSCLIGSSLSAVLAFCDWGSGKNSVRRLSSSVLLSSRSAWPGFSASLIIYVTRYRRTLALPRASAND